MNFTVTQFGKPLAPSLYSWNEKTKTFSTIEWNVVLDFSGIDGITFRTSNFCTFKTGSNCIFKTGSNCSFDTGSFCVFKTDADCTFTTGSNCVFKTIYYCSFNTGSFCVFNTGHNCNFDTSCDCTFYTGFCCVFKTGPRCVFNTGRNCSFEVGERCILIHSCFKHIKTYNLKPNHHTLLLYDKIIESARYINANNYIITWRKDWKRQKLVRVGCQEHSIKHWKKNYKQIAKDYYFPESLIPKFLKHLNYIEST